MSSQTKDLEDSFFSGIKVVATELGADPEHMLSVMMSEAGVRANAHNPNGDASGLIQFMPKTLINLGWTKGHEEFRKLSATQQLLFVKKYYGPYIGHLDTIAGLYVATFLPALISHCGDKDYVLVAKGGQLGWAFEPNASFDANHDLKITVQELEDAVMRNCVGARWAEIEARLSGNGLNQDTVYSDNDDLGTVRGIQNALHELGFDPGIIDGIPGPKTYHAIKEFQEANGLVADGVVGPKTKAIMETQL